MIDQVKLCPCCGESREANYETEEFFGLYVGVESAFSVCVKCLSCGLRMIRNLPDIWPKGTWRKGDPDGSMERLRAHTLELAVKAWNRRA